MTSKTEMHMQESDDMKNEEEGKKKHFAFKYESSLRIGTWITAT